MKRPRKPSLRVVQKQEPLTVLERLATSWKAIATAVGAIFLLGGASYAVKDRYETKAEIKADIAPLSAAVSEHNAELREIRRSLSDLKDGQKQSQQWLWELHQQYRFHKQEEK